MELLCKLVRAVEMPSAFAGTHAVKKNRRGVNHHAASRARLKFSLARFFFFGPSSQEVLISPQGQESHKGLWDKPEGSRFFFFIPFFFFLKHSTVSHPRASKNVKWNNPRRRKKKRNVFDWTARGSDITPSCFKGSQQAAVFVVKVGNSF